MTRSFTLIEILVIAGGLIFALLGAFFFGKEFDGIWARPLGCFSGCFVFVLLSALLGLIKARLIDGIPYVPVCRNGCCRRGDYRVEKIENRYCWTCRCGDSYDRVGRRYVLLEGENERPYLVWHFIKGWIPDEQGRR